MTIRELLDRSEVLRQTALDQAFVMGALGYEVKQLIERHNALLAVSKALVNDVRNRHPGEALKCPYLAELAEQVDKCT